MLTVPEAYEEYCQQKEDPNEENRELFKVEELTPNFQENELLFGLVANIFVPPIHGRKPWTKLVDGKKVHEKKVSEIVPVSTKGLVIVTIENSYSYWKRCNEER